LFREPQWRDAAALNGTAHLHWIAEAHCA